MCVKKEYKRNRFPHIAMCFDANEMPLSGLKTMSLCVKINFTVN